MATVLCRVCRQRTAEYTCPRCNARYCSLECYRQHSEQCTEGFYRDAAVSELRSITAGEDEKKGMMEILQRLHQQELGGTGSEEEEEGEGSEGEEEGPLSSETLHRLLAKMQAAGGELEVSAEDLTPAELAAFHRALAAGELSGAVQPWQPWWLGEEAAQLELGAGGTRLMVAVEGQGGGEEAQPAAGSLLASSTLPEPPRRALPPLSALTKQAPSPLLQHQLLDLLFAYCLTLRRYNGEYQCEAEAAADDVFALSAVLAAVAPTPGSTSGGGSGGDGGAVASTLLGCLQRACQPPAGGSDSRGLAIACLSDVGAMLRLGRAVVLTALMDLSRLLEAARQQLEAAGSNAGAGSKQRCKELRRQLAASERKLLFFMAWANEQAPEVYGLLAVAVAAEQQKHAQAAAMSGGRPPGGTVQAAAAAAGAGSTQPEDASSVLIEEL